MARCLWPRGCLQESFFESLDEMCYYHAKVVAGHISADRYFMAPVTVLPHEEGRRSLMDTLAGLGATPDVISSVAEVPLNPDHFSRHGQGYLPQGMVVG